MTVTISPRALTAFASGLAVALIAVFVFQAWRVDAAPGNVDVTFVPLSSPCRLIDTRPGESHVGPHDTFGPTDTKTIMAGQNGNCVIPNVAVGLSLNVTAVNATAASFLTIWPDGERPEASSLNPAPGQPPTPNAVTTTLSDGGSFEVFNLAGTVDVIVDVNGFYTQTALKALADDVAALRAALPFTVASEPRERVRIGSSFSEIRSVTVSAPVKGQVAVIASGYMIEDGGSTRCGLVKNTVRGPADDFDLRWTTTRGSGASHLSASRVFDVAADETVKFILVCQELLVGEVAGDTKINSPQVTAIFTPAVPVPCTIGTRGCRTPGPSITLPPLLPG